MAKSDLILEHIISMEGKLGAIEQHLKTLNGRVEKSEKNILSNKEGIVKIDKRWAKAMGAFTGIVVVVEIIIYFVMK